MTFAIRVTTHAATRALERFPGFDTSLIPGEVNAAMAEGRWSPRKPAGLMPPDDPACFYVWTPDGERVYAIVLDATDHSRFAVKTTMRTVPDRDDWKEAA